MNLSESHPAEQEKQLVVDHRGLHGFAAQCEAAINAVGEQMQQLSVHLATPVATASLMPGIITMRAPAVLPAQAAPPVPLAHPEKFSGDSGDCRAFLTQCDLHFELQSAMFPSDRSKIAYLISHLTGRAAAWARAEWCHKSTVCTSLPAFIKAFSQMFQRVSTRREAGNALMNLCQGRRRVVDYAVELKILALKSGWNSEALIDKFQHGLSDAVKDRLFLLDIPDNLDDLIALAIKIDNRLLERERERVLNKTSSRPTEHRRCHTAPTGSWCFPPRSFDADPDTPSSTPSEKLGEVGRARLSPEERERRFRQQRCLYCGQHGHLLASCPVKGQTRGWMCMWQGVSLGKMNSSPHHVQ
uniref:CCHC-type domain-containing protein n=1 Tax=Salarias fasciatus TaxID=181472 RepID=A0A672F1J4_SALFA